MKRIEDLEYYRQRVIIERERATKAPSSAIAKVHMELSALYEQYVEAQDERSPFPWRPCNRAEEHQSSHSDGKAPSNSAEGK